ncbi:peptidase domain-containing ABC transporter [Thermocoleostomius sinensis]|uniref:Peptidase domain-containing ABC transporter n=1 Tax=Thermocoleostomius sinensis A174 TaxID=2016057 RepID=A0A9E8ZCA4_9CYAN|nr:peptidase domain-containing ABC transporter [Thermocoleostomius sinensis]WAL58763.1 peptidase domain-containing ABC transporter [Thermocoleostomius sinensis A174]
MRYPLVLQHSEEDCGAACLASIAKHHGRTFLLSRIREAIGTGQLGTTLLGLRRGAESLGLFARSASASPKILDHLDRIPLPAIIHWRGKHWVVLYGKRGHRYVVADPAIGLRYLSEDELTDGWKDWVILLLEPDPSRFYAQSSDRVDGVAQFWTRVLPYRHILLEAVLCASLIGLLSLASPVFIQILTDDVLIQGDTRLLFGVVIAVVVMYLIRSGLSLVADNLIAHFAQRLELGFILEFGQQILRLPLTYYETRRSGEVVSRLRDIEEINRLVSEAVVSLPSSILIAFVSLGLMLFYSWKLALVALLVALVMTISTIGFQPILRQKTRQAMVLETENQGVLVETFKGALTLKTTTAGPQFWEELQSRFGRLANLMFRTTQIGIINSTFSSLVSDIGRAILLGLGSMLVINQELSIGQLLAFTTLNSNVVGLIDELVDYVDDWIRVQTASARLQEVITATPETQDDDRKPWATLPDDATITCANLNFHYPGRTELLQDFSLTLPGGQTIAIIGRSGCGKSTLAKVIAGLYSIQSGNIRIGMYNLDDLSIECVRQQIVLIPQEAHFWSRSIIENFRMGNPHLSFEEIVSACQITGADEFISRLPEKYQTILGEFGSNLSGGQRQRLAIARALSSQPPILILDESTSGLDPASEADLLDKLLWHRQGKTTILISHRPKVIRQADWIVFLEEGKLKLEGTQMDLQAQVGDHLDFLEV